MHECGTASVCEVCVGAGLHQCMRCVQVRKVCMMGYRCEYTPCMELSQVETSFVLYSPEIETASMSGCACTGAHGCLNPVFIVGAQWLCSMHDSWCLCAWGQQLYLRLVTFL